jgi:hypothetical protein
MDVHAPHQSVHTWRDFFTHIVIITIGLFIALMMEAGVEWMHHRHLVHQAEANLHAEISGNREELNFDLRQIDGIDQEIAANIATLNAVKAHQPAAQTLALSWAWNGMESAAWDTARDTGALALMPYDRVQSYASIYAQQATVGEQFTVFMRDFYRSSAPARDGRKPTDLQPAELDAMIANSQLALADLKYLRDLSESLGRIYEHKSAYL